jgi:archaellin
MINNNDVTDVNVSQSAIYVQSSAGKYNVNLRQCENYIKRQNFNLLKQKFHEILVLSKKNRLNNF